MLFLDANTLGQSHLAMGERVLTALLGYAVVFAGLLVLMAIVAGMGAVFKAIGRKKSASAAAQRGQALRGGRHGSRDYDGDRRRSDGQAAQRTALQVHQGGQIT